ncbi:MAG TPA: DJ-1/PfpI family protein [Gemmatimonadaceae bacterium]|nr:DJ-1/PfpI family protein [Gemmatimonadaceae bacterium]
MTSPSTAVLIFEGFADWEPSFALTGLRRWGNRSVKTFGYDLSPVTSMGGLRVTPDAVLDDLVPDSTELLILPGGDMWEREYPADRLAPILYTLRAKAIPIAGICAATIAMARAELFRDRRHTSNGRDFLSHYAPGYETPSMYVEDTLAVADRGVISASGLGAVEFAAEIFTTLKAFPDPAIAQFRAMYRAQAS